MRIIFCEHFASLKRNAGWGKGAYNLYVSKSIREQSLYACALARCMRCIGSGGNMSEHSAYCSMTGEEAGRVYLRRVRTARVVFGIAAAVFLSLAFSRVIWGQSIFDIWYWLALAVVFVMVFVFRMRMSQLFKGLVDIVEQDGDPTKYRVAIEEIGRRSKLEMSSASHSVELAYADLGDAKPYEALERLASTPLKRARKVVAFRAFNVEILARIEVGDEQGARLAAQRLSEISKRFRGGSRNRRVTSELVENVDLWLRPHEEWTAADGEFIRNRMAQVPPSQSRVSWQLYAAEYELLHGSREEAKRLLDELAAGALTPRNRARLERLRDR